MWFISRAFTLVALIEVTTGATVHIYVSPTGQDSNNGLDLQHPVKSLHRAEKIAYDTSMAGNTVYVELLAGYHELTSTLQFNTRGSQPVTFRAYQGQEVHVTGGRRIPTNLFKPVTDRDILRNWTAMAGQKVRQVHLPDAGITDYGKIRNYGWYMHRMAPLELFINGKPLHLARYPNTGYIDILSVSNTSDTTFTYDSTRDRFWPLETDPWAYGYWFSGWEDFALQISHIDPKTHSMTLASKPRHGILPGKFGPADVNFHAKQGGYFQVFNFLTELDEPGEYYVDRDTGMLYVWPNTPTETLTSSDSVYASLRDDCITIGPGVSNLVFEDFTLEDCRRFGINARNVRNVQLNNMEIKNTGSFGFECGSDCRSVTISRCEIHDGDGGIEIRGGNRATLEPSGNIIEDNHIWNYARESAVGQDAIHITGVHGIMRYNHIHDGQYAGIYFEGNDHILEYNNIHDMCVTTSDCGAVFARRSWSSRGNVIRYNHIHHNLRSVPGDASRGIMLDDLYASVLIENNVFYENEIHVNIGGGRDNIVRDNIMYNATAETMQMDARGLSPVFSNLVKDLRQDLKLLHYNQGIWKTKYPEMSTLADGHDTLPEGNEIYNNIIWNPTGIRTYLNTNMRYAKPEYFNIHDNHEVHNLQDFTAPSYRDFRLRCAAKQWADGANFQTPISINDVGPRHPTGPTYLHTALPTYPAAPSPAPCDTATVAPATSAPAGPYISDGSTPNTLFPNLTVGCWMIAQSCPKHPGLVGTQRDVEGEKHFHAGTDEDKCLSRAVTRWLDCGSDPNHYVQAVFGPTGAMTVAGAHCYAAYESCPDHQPHPTLSVDGAGEGKWNASISEEACLGRATDFYPYCGSDPNYPITLIFGPTGAKTTVGAGCWIKVTSCPADPKLGTFFYDAWGATNANSDASEYECYERGTYYWQHCGSHREFPVTAYFRPLGTHRTVPKSI